MLCPECGSSSAVIDQGRLENNSPSKYRIRECCACKYTWRTIEQLDEPPSGVSTMVKKREMFISGGVYFVQGSANGLIKIGSANNIKQRYKDLSYMSPVPIKLIHWVGGGPFKEKELHKRFEKHRKHGEWFEPAQEIMDFIEESKKSREENQ